MYHNNKRASLIDRGVNDKCRNVCIIDPGTGQLMNTRQLEKKNYDLLEMATTTKMILLAEFLFFLTSSQ